MIWLRLALVVVILAIPVISYNVGVKNGKRDIVAEIEKARAASKEEKERIDEEINNLDDDELLRRALEFVR